jgi:hypothetical protein
LYCSANPFLAFNLAIINQLWHSFGMDKKPKRPRDVNQLAWQIVRESTGQAEPEFEPEKDEKKVEAGRKGGLAGGKARAEKLTPRKRKTIAKKAAAKRWSR